MFEELFRFPVANIDGDNEDRKRESKEKYGTSTSEEEYDIIFGEAEYPYHDFVGVEDRWLPSTSSFNKALDGKFDACLVRFSGVGQLLVPWTKKKFKAEILKFAEEYNKLKPEKKEVQVFQKTIGNTDTPETGTDEKGE